MIREHIPELLSAVVSDPSSRRVFRFRLYECTDDEIRYLLSHETRKTARRIVGAEAKRRGMEEA